METIFSKNSIPGKGDVAFFDLDGTVISANSGRSLIKYAYDKGFIRIPDLLRGALVSFMYRFNLRDTVKLINSLIGWLKGIQVSALDSLSEEMFRKHLVKFIRPEIKEKILLHKKEGVKVVLLSSAIEPVCRQIAAYLEMDDIICSILEIKNGLFTGNPSGSLCFGKEKVLRLNEYCENNRINPSRAWYYGDSIDDLPVMLSVGNPVCVNPDRRLKKEAEVRGWDILSLHKE